MIKDIAMEITLGMPIHNKIKASTTMKEFLPLEKMTGKSDDEDAFINERLKTLDQRCTDISNSNPGKECCYAIKLIRTICGEISTLKLDIVADRPFHGWYCYDGSVVRNIASIVLKIDLLSNKYFAKLYKKYTFITSHKSCNSMDKVYELVDEWLSDRRTMVDLVSAMLDEIQDLGITPNPLPLEKPENEGSLMDILGNLLPGKGF